MNTVTHRLISATLALAAVSALAGVAGVAPAPMAHQLPVVVMPTVMVVARREALMPVAQLPMVMVTGRRSSIDELRLAEQVLERARQPG